MIASATTQALDERALRRLVHDALPPLRAGTEELIGIEHARLATTTSYPTVAVTARLRGGRTVRLFLKDFGSSQLPKDDVDRRPRRELHVYRDLLADTGLGPPEYRGSLWDERTHRLWLLLELVDGVQLRDCGFDAWIPSAAWLARLHAHFDGRAADLERSALLVRHDEDWFCSKAQEALRDMRRFSARARRRTAQLVAGHEELAATMAAQPRTLVHGNYRSKNIVIARSQHEVRVAPVDWEVAAIGSRLYDLGHLTDGYRGAQLRALLDAYGEPAAGRGLALPPEPEALRLMAAYCLHRVVKSLARAVEKGFDERDVAKLLAHGERLREGIFR